MAEAELKENDSLRRGPGMCSSGTPSSYGRKRPTLTVASNLVALPYAVPTSWITNHSRKTAETFVFVTGDIVSGRCINA